MCGAFIWAELATRLPGTGGQYLYLREAYHPSVAFVYGWGLLLVTQTGGMAAVAVIFSSYFRALTGVGWNDSVIAATVLLILTGINCLGARAGSNVQSALMLLKIGALAALVTLGFAFGGGSLESGPLLGQPASLGLLKSIGSAMVPIAFAYGGWQTATFVAGEMRDARRDLSRGLLLGVAAVVGLYLAVNLACLRVLGPAGLDATTTPASDVMRIALGERGAQWIAAGIAISTLGFLSQSMLTAPRVYYAMARDGLFFESVGKLSPRSRAPVVAIVLQGLAAIVIACSGTYGEILNFEVTVDFIFFRNDGGIALHFAAATGGIRHRHLPRAGTPVSRRSCLSCPAPELSEAPSLLRLPIARSRYASCWLPSRFTIIGADSDEPAHETQAFRLHALVQDAEPSPVQSGNEWRRRVSSSRTASGFGETRN